MSRHVLVPMDGSEQAERALEHAIETFPEGDLTVLTAVDPTETWVDTIAGAPGTPYESPLGHPGVSEEWFENAQERAEEHCERAREIAAEHGYEGLETVVETGPPARVVVEYADDHGVDQIVVGSHGRSGVTRVLLGSVAESIVRRASMPVTVVR